MVNSNTNNMMPLFVVCAAKKRRRTSLGKVLHSSHIFYFKNYQRKQKIENSRRLCTIDRYTEKISIIPFPFPFPFPPPLFYFLG